MTLLIESQRSVLGACCSYGMKGKERSTKGISIEFTIKGKGKKCSKKFGLSPNLP